MYICCDHRGVVRFCFWGQSGSPGEHFLEIVHLKRVNAESINSALVECLKEKQLQVSKIVGMGFDGASTFSVKKTRVQVGSKGYLPIFVTHCHCNWLVFKLLACVQAAISTDGIKHMYVTLTALRKLPLLPEETRVSESGSTSARPTKVKYSQTFRYTLACTRGCVKVVKTSYGAIVITFNDIYENTHELEALGLAKLFCTCLAMLFLRRPN